MCYPKQVTYAGWILVGHQSGFQTCDSTEDDYIPPLIQETFMVESDDDEEDKMDTSWKSM